MTRLVVPRLALGDYPTRVERIDALCTDRCALYVKHDDAASPVYGGNKVRKLEPILADAKRRGSRRIVTVGAAGSHHVLATTLFAREHGLRAAAVLVPQRRTPHAMTNLRVAIGAGLEPFVATGYPDVPLRVLAAMRADSTFVALGGSNDLGTLGYVLAGLELGDQVARGELPEPDLVIAPLGSGGTVAGLAVGLEAAGLRTRVMGVAVSAPEGMFGAMARRLVARVARRVGVAKGAAQKRIAVVGTEIGEGYGIPTARGDEATARARSVGLTLDPTYTAKAFAATLDEVARGEAKTVVFWQTLSSASLEARAREAPALPRDLDDLFV